jgi:alpha-glucosidase (family GH31 glycosyl hydrolase)
VEAVLLASALLKVAVERDPWAVTFGVLDQAGPIRFLTEPRARPSGAFRPAADPGGGEWYEATRVRDEDWSESGYSAILKTDHPDGLTASIDIRLTDDATVSARAAVEGAAVISQNFVARAGERFLGFGERSHLVSMDRGVVENYVGEGPYQPHEYPFLADTVPPWGIRNRVDATYFPIPWVLSTCGYGLLIDQDDLSYERFRADADDRWSIEVEADRLRYRVFAGPTPLQALERFTAATGRQPAPARWFFGPWYQTGHANHVPRDEEQRQLEALVGAPASAVETHCRYLPLGEDQGHEVGEKARTAFFHAEGLAVLSYLNPLVGREYVDAFDRAAKSDALQRDPTGRPYVFRAYVGGRVPPHADEAQYDFTNRQATACWAEIAERVVSAGYDGWMEDFGEYTPLDAVASDGSTGVAGHNRYPTDYHAAAAVAAHELEQRYGRRLARFGRSGWTGTAPALPIVWGGDPTTSWGFDGLASAVTQGLSMGASGVAMWGSDTGGFLSTLERLTPELLRRWVQFSAFCPVMRTKSGGIEIPPYERPQIWDADVLPWWKRWARWHLRLNDYLMAAHTTYRATGRPIMCALELAYPTMGPVTDQYLLGEHLLVAPVLQPGCASRRVVFPDGHWVDLFDPTRRFAGPGVVDVEVGPDDIPVFVRAGAVLALLPDEVNSLSPYAPFLAGRREVRSFPGGASWSGPLGPDHACRSEVGDGSWSLEFTAARPFTWDLAAWLPGRPSDVDVDGAWSFDGGVLRCSVTGTSQTVRVRWPTGYD